MSSDKTVVVFGCLATTESTYGAGTTTLVAATHGVQLAELPSFDPSYAYDGNRPIPAGTYGQSRRSAPSGKTFASQLRIEGKGAGGATYTASVVPPNIHDFILASGYDGAVATNEWTYTPTPGPTGFDSLELEMYGRGELWPVTAAYCSMKIIGENEGPSIFEFDVRGILGTRSDSAVPSITYAALTVVPPSNDNVTLTINSVGTLIVRSYEFDDASSVENPRRDINTSGAHAGFVRGRRTPVFTCTVENPDTSELNVWGLADAGTVLAASLVVGTSAFNKFTLTLAQCTMIASLNDEDPASLVDLEIFPHASTPIANDDVELVFD